MSDSSTMQATSSSERPIWQVALIALAILLVISELACLLSGMAAKNVIDSGATAHDGLSGALSNAHFMYAASDNGPPVFTMKGFYCLPGFNSLYYIVLGPLDSTTLVPFITSGAVALLIGFLALLCHLSICANRGFLFKLMLAIPFAIGWVVLYTQAESSIYGGTFGSNMPTHHLEVPVAFISLLMVSLSVRRRT